LLCLESGFHYLLCLCKESFQNKNASLLGEGMLPAVRDPIVTLIPLASIRS
jgi:hypothetical protein